MNVLLVQPRMNWEQTFAEVPSVALLILGTLAKQRGHKVRILHLDIDRVSVEDEVRSFKPDIVGVTLNTFQVRSARAVAKAVRSVSSHIRLVIGGPHAMAWDGEGDNVVVGEGENAWLELLGHPAEVHTIDDVPVPDYNLVDLRRFCGTPPMIAPPSMSIMASRGCPGQCIFCNTPLFWGKKVRYRNPELVLEEIETLHRHHGINEVFFQDDTFNLNHDWATAIFEGILRRNLQKRMAFKVTGRVNRRLTSRPYLELAKRAGVWNIFYGVESGSQAMLDNMKKGTTVEESRAAIALTHEVGIDAQCSFVVGCPGETWQTLRETDKLIHEIKPTRYGWAYACPFPGTELDKIVTAKGHKRHVDYSQYGYGALLVRTDSLTFDDLAQFRGFTYTGGYHAAN